MEYKITIENFKSIQHSELTLKKGLNILIGPNGAGKTCALTSLKFLKDMLQKGVGLAMAKGGGPSRLYHRGKKLIRFRIELDFGEKVFKKKKRKTKCIWFAEIEQKGSERLATISYESLKICTSENEEDITLFQFTINRKNFEKPRAVIFLDLESGKDIFNSFYKDNRSLSKEKLFEKIQETLKSISNHPDFKKNGERSILTFLERFDNSFFKLIYFFTSINEYNIIPERARQATEQLPFARMSPNGFGVSEVIEALEKKNFHKLQLSVNSDLDFDMPLFGHAFMYVPYGFRFYSSKRKNPLSYALDNINKELSAAVKPITSISVEIDQTNGRRFVVFKSENEKYYPDEVSDGTIKWLCILTSIYVGFSNIYLLEEPENFLHPWMQQKLIQIMREQSEENDSIYLLTTHSTTLLNSAYPDEVITVKQKDKGSILERISNTEDIQRFLDNSDFRLGDLWVSGGIGAIPQ